MSDDPFSTRKVSPDEISQLQEMMKKAGEMDSVTIDLDPQVAARVLALIPALELEDGSSEELVFAMAVRQIFMTGLHQLESELDE